MTDRLTMDMLDLRTWLIHQLRAGGGPTVTYSDAATRVARMPVGMGPLLDTLEGHCAQRGEPNLAVLVVSKATGEPTKYAMTDYDWAAEQDRCLATWGSSK